MQQDKQQKDFIVYINSVKLKCLSSVIKSVCKSRKEIVAPTSVSMAAAITWPIEVTVGGATLFVLDIDRFEKV